MLSTADSMGLRPWPESGEARIGWRTVGTDDRSNRILIFHGNAGHSLHRGRLVEGLTASPVGATCDVYLLEYPGFGSRAGRPSEGALVRAATEAVDRLVADDPSRPIYLIGESIGSGVASQVAAARPGVVPGILLITPFTNLVDVGATFAPRFLVRTFIHDRYDNEAALSVYDGRVGVLLAGLDEVIPVHLGRSLYDGYTGEKRLWVEEAAGHNTLDYSSRSPSWTEATLFLVSGP